jgi:hypothetical protein
VFSVKIRRTVLGACAVAAALAAAVSTFLADRPFSLRAWEASTSSMSSATLAFGPPLLCSLADLWVAMRKGGWTGVRQHWVEHLKRSFVIVTVYWAVVFFYHRFKTVPDSVYNLAAMNEREFKARPLRTLGAPPAPPLNRANAAAERLKQDVLVLIHVLKKFWKSIIDRQNSADANFPLLRPQIETEFQTRYADRVRKLLDTLVARKVVLPADSFPTGRIEDYADIEPYRTVHSANDGLLAFDTDRLRRLINALERTVPLIR